MLEISKMLTLGTMHIRPETGDMLDREAEDNALGLSVYPKTGSGERFGWFIYLPRTLRTDGLPKDLLRCMALAMDLDCAVLCLDADGPEQPYLETYDWD